MKRNTPWTPWMPVNVTQGGARQEQRMRYMCRAHLSDPHELQIGRRKVETRFCPNDGTAACETDSKFNGRYRDARCPNQISQEENYNILYLV